MSGLLQTFLIVGVVIVILGAIFREVLCWFWKINLQVSLLEDISKKLDSLGGSGLSNASKVASKTSLAAGSTEEQILCPGCGTLTNADGDFCEQCGKKLEKHS
jgi:hypothetical protein